MAWRLDSLLTFRLGFSHDSFIHYLYVVRMYVCRSRYVCMYVRMYVCILYMRMYAVFHHIYIYVYIYVQCKTRIRAKSFWNLTLICRGF